MELKHTITFKDSEFLLSLKAGADSLSLSITNCQSQDTWANTFTSKAIEILTEKTGNTKSFTVFCKLLLAAIQKKNPSLHLDFYSYQDLESIRKGSESLSSSKPSKKKYLIISYVTDFEKAHYPLPLIFQDQSLNKNYEVSRPSSDSYSENAKLKQENAALLKNLSSYQDEFLTYKERTERKIEELTGIKQDLEDEIKRMKDELDFIIIQIQEEAHKRSKPDEKSDIKSANMKLARFKEENQGLRNEINKCRKEIEILRQNDISSKKLIDALSSQIDSSDYKEDIHSPISAESPAQTFSKINGLGTKHIKQDSADVYELKERLMVLQKLISKNKS